VYGCASVWVSVNHFRLADEEVPEPIPIPLGYLKNPLHGAVADFFIFSDRVYCIHMLELFNQIIDIAKNIGHVFDTSIWPPLVVLLKSIGMLFVKVLELSIMAVKWIVAKV